MSKIKQSISILTWGDDTWCFTTDHCQPCPDTVPITFYTRSPDEVVEWYGAENLAANPDGRYEPDYAYVVFAKLGMV